jgi:predicted nucleic acid-binding protein
MVLVDTSVWISHLRVGNTPLARLLESDEVACHAFIIGELACGNLRNRSEILSLLQSLPKSIEATHEEVMVFINNHSLMGKGIGYIDAHLLASAALSGIPICTFDKKLKRVSSQLRINYE